MSPREAAAHRNTGLPDRSGSDASSMHRLELSSSEDRVQARLGWVTFVGIVGFMALIVSLHVLRPDLDPIQRPTSEYSVGRYGWVMTVAFLTLSLATATMLLGLRRDVAPDARSRSGMVLLAIWAVGVLVAAVFPADLDGAPQTIAGTIHNINGPITFLSLVIGANLFSRRLKNDTRWSSISKLLSVLAALMAVEFVVNGAAAAREIAGGLAQRILLATLVIWYLLIAWRLRSNAQSHISDQRGSGDSVRNPSLAERPEGSAGAV